MTGKDALAAAQQRSRLAQFVEETHERSASLLHELGLDPEAKLRKAARAVVWARHYSGDDGWDRLKAAIGDLEDLVGLPTGERDI
jgi:hypothetical protein